MQRVWCALLAALLVGIGVASGNDAHVTVPDAAAAAGAPAAPLAAPPARRLLRGSSAASSSASSRPGPVPPSAYPFALPPDDGSDEEETPPEPDPLPAGHAPSKADLQLLRWANEYRANHGAAPLTWDNSLAAGADYYASGCPLGHSGARGLGENMAWGSRDWRAALRSWYAESAAVDWASPGWNPEVGQFTQLVWRGSRALGCAVNRDCDGGPTYVCYFRPAGNLIGVDWARHVLRPARNMSAA